MRKVFFWIHLCAGCVAGIVIFIMSVTGVLLAFERQINDWVDRGYHSAVGEHHVFLNAMQGASNVTVRNEPDAPVAVSYGRDKLVYLDGTSGRVLGEASQTTRTFFVKMEAVHRALGRPLRGSWGKTVTDACNLIFLGLIASGLYLWMPRRWNWNSIRPAFWFRRRLRGKARDWNWHNAIGLWSAVPLFFIVLSSVIMSYAWANNLLYTLTGTTPPPAGIGGPPRDGGARRAEGAAVQGASLDSLLSAAGGQIPSWRTISFRPPRASDQTVVLSVDSGTGGQPQKRAQLTFDRKTGELQRTEDFSTNNLGRRLRLIARFLHTGEILGLPSQIIAALATLGGAFLVWTGISLVLRRASRWIKRRKRTMAQPAEAQTVTAEV